MIKKLLSLIVFIGFSFCLTFNVNGQGVGINPGGSAADNSAMLDISSTNKGMLIPRVNLLSTTDVVTIPSPAISLFVYNTNTSMTGGNGTGFYYWDGAKWSQVGGSTGITPCAGSPPTPGPIIGSGIVSANTTYPYFVPVVSGAATYTWSYSGSGATISGLTNSVNIYFSASATSGNLTVTASCGNGNSTSATFAITLIPVTHSSITFTYTGNMQTWIVPPGIYSVTVDCFGAQGATNNSSGGRGGEAKGTLSVLPQQALYIFTGKMGGNSSTLPGWNGGGPGNYASGGGASDVRMGGADLANRIIVAGGGGGGSNGAGGHGGGSTGGTGNTNGSATGGGGGTQSGGGAAGSPGGNAGSLGIGGTGFNGGGGGGGYYGGGGGGSASNSYPGGGGGSSYFSSSVTAITNTQGVQSGDGQIIITY